MCKCKEIAGIVLFVALRKEVSRNILKEFLLRSLLEINGPKCFCYQHDDARPYTSLVLILFWTL